MENVNPILPIGEKKYDGKDIKLINDLVKQYYPTSFSHNHDSYYFFYFDSQDTLKFIEYTSCKYGHKLVLIGQNFKMVLVYEDLKIILSWLEMIFRNVESFTVKTPNYYSFKLSNFAISHTDYCVLNNLEYFLLSYGGGEYDTIIAIDKLKNKFYSIQNNFELFECDNLQSHYIFSYEF